MALSREGQGLPHRKGRIQLSAGTRTPCLNPKCFHTFCDHLHCSTEAMGNRSHRDTGKTSLKDNCLKHLSALLSLLGTAWSHRSR